MDKEFNLSEKIKHLFEIEYLDSMADVQGDVTKVLKEFIRRVKEELENEDNKAGRDRKIDKLAGERMCQ